MTDGVFVLSGSKVSDFCSVLSKRNFLRDDSWFPYVDSPCIEDTGSVRQSHRLFALFHSACQSSPRSAVGSSKWQLATSCALPLMIDIQCWRISTVSLISRVYTHTVYFCVGRTHLPITCFLPMAVQNASCDCSSISLRKVV
jgi:hypothetical protein